MKLSTSTGDFSGHVRTIADMTRAFAGSPFKYINLEQGGDAFLCDNDDEYKKKIEEWRAAAQDAGVKYVVSHSPCLNPFSTLTEEHYAKVVRAMRRSIEICGALGIGRTVVHAGYNSTFTPGDFLKENKRYYRDLLETAEKYNVILMTENMDYPEHYHISTGKEMREFVDFIDHPLMGACWDTAHANNNSKARYYGQYKCILDIGDKLKGLHIADNLGDGLHHHTWPFAGTINWDEVVRGLIDVSYDGYFNFEASYTLMHQSHYPCRRKAWEKSEGETVTTLLNPSTELKKKAVELMYECGKYLLETYNVFEL